MERKKGIEAMRASGMTYNEIGQVLGVSRQRVHQIAHRKRGDHFHVGAVEKIPYIGLRNWMLENRVSVTELSKLCGVRQLKLNGKHSMRMETANKVVQLTGMTFEECFRRDDNG